MEFFHRYTRQAASACTCRVCPGAGCNCGCTPQATAARCSCGPHCGCTPVCHCNAAQARVDGGVVARAA